MKSLLLIGFPRGFTSEAYRISTQMLPALRESGISSGEVLNQQRNPAFEAIPFHVDASHPQYEHYYECCKRELLKYEQGYIIKDVVQPYLVLRFLQEYPDRFNVLFVHRPVEHVRFALERKKWAFVQDIDSLFEQFNRYPSIDIGRAYHDPSAFQEALKGLYSWVLKFDYLTENFKQNRDAFFRQYEAAVWSSKVWPLSADIFMAEGFYPYEQQANLSWSSQQSFSVTVDLSRVPFPPAKLKLKLMLPGVFKGHELQLDCLVAGNQRASVTLVECGEPQWLEVDIKASDLTGGSLVLGFTNSHLRSPRDEGISPDSRNLGAGIAAIAVMPADSEIHKTELPPASPSLGVGLMNWWKAISHRAKWLLLSRCSQFVR